MVQIRLLVKKNKYTIHSKFLNLFDPTYIVQYIPNKYKKFFDFPLVAMKNIYNYVARHETNCTYKQISCFCHVSFPFFTRSSQTSTLPPTKDTLPNKLYTIFYTLKKPYSCIFFHFTKYLL